MDSRTELTAWTSDSGAAVLAVINVHSSMFELTAIEGSGIAWQL